MSEKKTTAVDLNTHPGKQGLQEFRKYVNKFDVYAEREKELSQLMYAVLMQEHLLLKGRAGTGKSELVKQFLHNITGTKLFSQQFTAFMDENYVFGSPLIDELKKGNIVHNIKDSLVDSEFAFLDEFFNANEELIISCNEIFNERKLSRNAQKVDAPLITAIMTTNQNREGEEKLKPIYDRILFTSIVNKVVKDRQKMYLNALSGRLKVQATFSKSKLFEVYDYIKSSAVDYSKEIIDVFDRLLAEYQTQANVYISDRKAVKSLKFLKVVALVNEDTSVTINSLQELKYVWVASNDVINEATFDGVYVSIVEEYKSVIRGKSLLKDLTALASIIEEDSKRIIGYKSAKNYLLVMKGVTLRAEDIKKAINKLANLHEEMRDEFLAKYENLVSSLVKDEIKCLTLIKNFEKPGTEKVAIEGSDDGEASLKAELDSNLANLLV